VRPVFSEICEIVDDVYAKAETNPRARFDLREARTQLYERAVRAEMAAKTASAPDTDFPAPESGGMSIEP
jgi:hypothetical protein